MIYKKIEIEEMEHFWSLLNALDAETNFMMYEPNGYSRIRNGYLS